MAIAHCTHLQATQANAQTKACKRVQFCQRTSIMRTLIYILLFVIGACTTSKNASNSNIETIAFGSGGGFTGAVTTYSLSSNGQLNKVERNKNISVKTVDRKTVKELFEKANELKSYKFNEPENIYSFLEIQTKENKQNITWGFGSTKVDNRVTTLYNELMILIKKSKS